MASQSHNTSARRKRKPGKSNNASAIIITLIVVAVAGYFVFAPDKKKVKTTEESNESRPLIPKPAREGWAENGAKAQPEVAATPEPASVEDDSGDLADAKMDAANNNDGPAVTLKDGRQWSDSKGHKTVAELVTADSTTVSLRREDGKVIKVKLSLLSQADRDFVTAWRTAQTAVVAKPVSPPPRPALGSSGPVKEGEPAGFGAEWPTSAYVPDELGIKIVKEDDSDKDYIYESTHFRFTCDVQLRTRLVNECAKVFEATHEFLRLMPLNNRDTKGTEKKFPVFIFETYEDYVKAGGPPGSAGVCIYRGDDTKVLVPLRSFGVRKTGKDYTVDTGDRDYKVLSHEITHQLMEHEVKKASWYIEGSAEYVAFTPYTGGRYKIAVNKKDIVASVTGYGRDNSGGRALGKEITMPRLKAFMTQSYQSFTSDSNFNYGVGCLLTYYFYHQDGTGEAERIKRYLDALQRGVAENAACDQFLLDGRTWEELEEEFRKGMRRFSVRIEYK